MKRNLLIIFVALVIIQWAVPAKMIWQKENVLRSGKVFHFRTEPVDPSHPFKGRYIILNYEAGNYTTTHLDSSFDGYGQDIYVLLNKDKDGFARVEQLVKEKPRDGVDFVKASIYYVNRYENDSVGVRIDFPFTEFYMDEFKAPKAESVYRESTIDSTQKTYAVVAVLHGDAVVKDVIINDKSIRQVVKEMSK